jgi:VanZ family protein
MIIKLLKKYWLTILLLVVIFILCFINPSDFPKAPVYNFDKIVHALMFMGLSGVIFFDNTRYLRSRISEIRIFSGTFLFPVAIGGLIEILQRYLTKTRTGDWMDFLYDVIGVIIGMEIAFIINHCFLKTISPSR